MGLDTSHDCWHGAYSAFMRWREKLAEVAGYPHLGLMVGFWSTEAPAVSLVRSACRDRWGNEDYCNSAFKGLPISWAPFEKDPLSKLLYHSDCDGEILAEDCAALADRLEQLLPLLPQEDAGGHVGSWKDKTAKFIEGLRDAAAKGENVEFR